MIIDVCDRDYNLTCAAEAFWKEGIVGEVPVGAEGQGPRSPTIRVLTTL